CKSLRPPDPQPSVQRIEDVASHSTRRIKQRAIMFGADFSKKWWQEPAPLDPYTIGKSHSFNTPEVI
ncbi:hypothetical protein, partial [Pararhizobium antarcticum]|uniref:hypothetical protein n=1 Tax=Pararhizobium antarcticum TaxID=1798805 RepID=UPI001AECCA01